MEEFISSKEHGFNHGSCDTYTLCNSRLSLGRLQACNIGVVPATRTESAACPRAPSTSPCVVLASSGQPLEVLEVFASWMTQCHTPAVWLMVKLGSIGEDLWHRLCHVVISSSGPFNSHISLNHMSHAGILLSPL